MTVQLGFFQEVEEAPQQRAAQPTPAMSVEEAIAYEVLQHCHVIEQEHGWRIALPSRDEWEIPRHGYEALKAVLTRLGGRYTTGGFNFGPALPVDVAVQVILESGVMPVQNKGEYFPTPKALADEMAQALEPMEDRTYIEPSAGSGALVAAVLKKQPKANVIAVEFNPLNVAMLRERFKGDERVEIVEANFEDWRPHELADGVIMNPPFQQAKEHIRRAESMVKPGRPLVTIAPANIKFGRRNWKDKNIDVLLDYLRRNGSFVAELPSNSFAESGTGVETLLMRSNVESTDWRQEPYNGFPSYDIFQAATNLASERKFLHELDMMTLEQPIVAGGPYTIELMEKFRAAMERVMWDSVADNYWFELLPKDYDHYALIEYFEEYIGQKSGAYAPVSKSQHRRPAEILENLAENQAKMTESLRRLGDLFDQAEREVQAA